MNSIETYRQTAHSDPVRETGRERLSEAIANVFFTEPLFDAMPDVVFFVKDMQGRYVVVNRTLATRCGHKNKQALVGKTTTELFPASLADSYAEQDQSVLNGDNEIHDQLELHLYPNRHPGWCLTNKIALRDDRNTIVGLTGISRDLAMPDQRHPVYHRIAAAVRHIHAHFSEGIQMADLAQITELSVAQIERYFQKIFSLTPRQMIIKIRLDNASAMLSDPGRSITDIAAACGYQDHSAFSRVFKTTTGISPSEYRETLSHRMECVTE